jgi:hypothetical protein
MYKGFVCFASIRCHRRIRSTDVLETCRRFLHSLIDVLCPYSLLLLVSVCWLTKFNLILLGVPGAGA